MSQLTLLHGQELEFEGGECVGGTLAIYGSPSWENLTTMAYALAVKGEPFIMVCGTDNEVAGMLALMIDGQENAEEEVLDEDPIS